MPMQFATRESCFYSLIIEPVNEYYDVVHKKFKIKNKWIPLIVRDKRNDARRFKKETYKDLPVDKEHLDTESLRNQDLYAKYLITKLTWIFIKAKNEYTKLYRDKWEYYDIKSDAKIYASKPFDLKVLKSDLNIYIESDQVIDAKNKIVYLETTVKFLEGVQSRSI